MVFSSCEFLFLFFPAALLVYFVSPFRIRNIALFAVSLIFYAWGEPVYVILMLATITVDYVCGYFVGKNRETNRKAAKIWMIAAIVLNLGALAFFKYGDFFVSNLNRIPGVNIPLLNIGLPIGISFYTFQALSYVIDVYRFDAEYQKNYASFGAYVTLYPQLIAGPIVRYADVDKQLRERTHSVSLFASGVRTFTCGFAKKILLANTAGEMWETLSASETVLGSWAALAFFMFQIYFDFSGYSDMAIGMGKMMGFEFRENFYYPYCSTSITDFWRRWHISLGTWFREYLYIPLGGNRCGKARQYFNIFVVWLATGAWHGASWNYILWGLYYFVLLVIEKAFLGKALSKLPSFVSRIYTLVFVFFGWWLFKFEDIGAGFSFLGTMFAGQTFTTPTVTYEILRSIVFIVIMVIACMPYPKRLFHRAYEKSAVFRNIVPVGVLVLLIVCVAYLVNSSYNAFLYTRF